MPGLRRALLALCAVGVLCAGADLALVLTSHHETQKVIAAILGPFIGLAFIGTGAFAWWRRPLNRFGLLMTAVGFAWFIGGMTESNDAVVYTVGTYVGPLYLVLVVQMLLSFPTGRLDAGPPRWIVTSAYVTAFVLTLPVYLLDGDMHAPDGAPDNAFAVLHAPGVADAIDVITSLIGFGVAAATVAVLVGRRRAATPPQRRARAARLWTGITVIVCLGLVFAGDTVGVPDDIIGLVSFVGFVAFAILPFAFVTGLVRTRYSRAGAGGGGGGGRARGGAGGGGGGRGPQTARDRETSLRTALSDALGDPTLQLV